MSEKKTTHYAVLDGMRGVAAIMVMIGHYIQSTDLVAHSNLPILTSGGLAVDFFFILSGFVIMHSYGAKLLNGMPASDYLWRRVVRLYPMFVMGLGLGTLTLVMLTLAGLTTYPSWALFESFVYNGLFLPFMNMLQIARMGALAPETGEIFPANPPSWSLFFEMIASVAFLGLVKLKRPTLIKVAIFSYCALIVTGVLQYLAAGKLGLTLMQGWGTANLLGGFPRVFYGFVMGLLVYQLATTPGYADRVTRAVGAYMNRSYVLYAVLILIFLFPKSIRGVYPLVVVGLLAPYIVYFGSQTPCNSAQERKIAGFLGWISYPLYCLHVPVGTAVFLLTDGHMSKGATIGIAIALSLVVSVVLSRFVEEPVRRFLGKKPAFFVKA